jgi:hypothetical protein
MAAIDVKGAGNMFTYQDPTESKLLQERGASESYGNKLAVRFAAAAKHPKTKFVTQEMLQGLVAASPSQTLTVPWIAFPRKRTSIAPRQIDENRSEFQEEYVEWASDYTAGALTKVTFTTEFPEYFQALADVSFEALVAGVQTSIPGAKPTAMELLGVMTPPAPLPADGIVGPGTWMVLESVLEQLSLKVLGTQPFLQMGVQGDVVLRLQEGLQSLQLLAAQPNGQFGPKTQAAVIAFQRKYTGAGSLFRKQLAQNPWNNGTKGILCLNQKFNTLTFLFDLLSHCSVPRPEVRPLEVCGLKGVSCVPERSSDPAVCSAAQTQILQGRCLSFKDPAGVRLVELQGIWQLNGVRLDINNPAQNQGIWQVSRGKRRGVLRNVPGLMLDGAPLVTGSQVARKLVVGVDVVVVN